MAITYKEKLRNSLRHAIDRCTNPNNQAYRYYGGRGIMVCERWLETTPRGQGWRNFLQDMGEPEDLNDFSLDRIDSNGNYEPSNCRWVAWREQARNTRRNLIVEYKGQKMPVGEAALLAGIKRTTVTERIRLRGWSAEKALNTPVGMRG